jgi:hypothetical protein
MRSTLASTTKGAALENSDLYAQNAIKKSEVKKL